MSRVSFFSSYFFTALLILKLCYCSRICFKEPTMVNCLNTSSSPLIISKKSNKQLPIDTMFRLPSPVPTWPKGDGFASGTIDLGGIQVSQISSFNKIWATHEGGPDNLGATFYEPTSLAEGFFMLGCYSQPNNQPLYGWVLVGKDSTSDQKALKLPIDYTLVWSSGSQNLKQDGVGYIWLPTPPAGYKAVGHVVTNSSGKPPLDKIRVIREDLTTLVEVDNFIWGQKSDFNVYGSRPSANGTQTLSVPTGAFIAQAKNNGTAASSLVCLKNVKNNLSGMPNLSQIQALVQAYAPVVYFHPDEQYFPSSVSWFFKNGALLYTKGQEASPVPIEGTGSNLPQNGLNDGAYWLDLPTNKTASDNLKKGNLQDVGTYLHVKPTFGAIFTDIALWIFYPFNGAARAKIELIDVNLGKIGEHVGDWEHMTLRISNFNGELKSVYFAQHSTGTWVSASGLEFKSANKPVSYSSLHGHASYPRAGLVLDGDGGIGVRNDAAKSKNVMDTGAQFLLVAAEYLDSTTIVEPPWLNYAREWGPKINYDINGELSKVEKLLPGKLKTKFGKIVNKLPNEALGEEGPTGPKWKDSWTGEERV